MVMSIRVLRPASPKQKLEQAQVYLEAYGTAIIEEAGEVVALNYVRSGAANQDVRFPMQDTGSLNITYNSHLEQWMCTSNLFGVPIRMGDPKLFSYNVLSMVEDRIGSKIQFMSKVQEYWQRYNGDSSQFTYCLGKDMVNTGIMTEVQDGSPVFAHFHNTFDTSFDVWFSANAAAGGGILPLYRFGFYPEIAMQPFELSVKGTQEVIETLQRQSSYVEAFLKPLISVF